MIIRSQCKTMILNMECIATIYIHELEYVDTKRILFNIETDKGFLGKYSTEEKAIKVLDMIQSAYVELNLNYPQYVANGYFEMPQDSEV